MRHHFRIALVGLLATLFLVGCSGNPVNQPAELVEFDPKIKLARLWKKDVGLGSNELPLVLRMAEYQNVIYTVDAEGNVFAIDRFSGKKIWKREQEEGVTGGIHAAASGLYYATLQGELVSLALDGSQEKWRQSLTSEAVAPPGSNDQIVVVQTIDGKLTAFDTESGKERWRFDSVSPKLTLRGTSSPVVSQDLTIAGFGNGELMAFDNGSGKAIWSYAVGKPEGRTELERLVDIDSQPLIVDELLYTVSFQGNLVAIDAGSGRELWSKPASSYAGLARGYSHLYISDSDGKLIALKEKNAQPAWQSELLKFRQLSTPVTFRNTLAVSDFEGYLHFFSQIDGELLTRIFPDEDGIMGPMLARDDILYVQTHAGDLFAYVIIGQ